ncbi:hypothetical protein F2Q69_00055389 [Brassica cretica]|uniref:Uncharacterized protein n=1 Tax=Brassica cretica TaxID=69181 RepID=A0A8S9MX21_BRACR|nr:hypothetical protein F2Q69_00055389 [Brassica cretica]
MKRNNRSPRNFLVSPRPGRQIVDGIPYRDEKWREHFFIFEFTRGVLPCLTIVEDLSKFFIELLQSKIPRREVQADLWHWRTVQLLMRIRKLENCATSHAYPSLMDRLDRRMSRRSMFRPAKSTQEKDALGSSSLIPIID